MSLKEQPKRIQPKAERHMREEAARVVRSPIGTRVIELACRFLLAAVLSAAEIFSGCTPFGLAFVAASGSGVTGFSALCGAVLGIFLTRGFTFGLRYAAAAVLIFSVSFALFDLTIYRRAAFMPLVSAAINAGTGLIYISSSGWTSSGLIFFVTEVFFTAAATYFYRIAFGESEAKRQDADFRQKISLLILIATALIALSDVALLADISLGRTIAATLVLLATSAGGAPIGGCMGLSLGLAMDFATGGAPFYTMAYGISGLIAGLLHDNGKILTTISFLITNTVAVLWTWASALHISSLYEVFLAAISFLLIPSSLYAFAERLFSSFHPAQGRRVQEGARDRLQQASHAFSTLYQTVRGIERSSTPIKTDAARVFDHAAESVCKSCLLREHCWQEQYVGTYNACNDALPAILRRGKAEAEDFPSHFSARCVNFPAFLSAINENLTALLQHRQYESRLQESHRVLAQQYGEMSTMLASIAQTIDDTPMLQAEDAPLMASAGIASRHKAGQSHCGDVSSFFQSSDGTAYLLLCDGMGSGAAAQAESSVAVSLLEEFLTAGVEPESALRSLATAFSLRAEGGGGFTTIDLLEVNLYTGKAAIYKYGAANSYLRRNTRVMAVTGNNLPAGAAFTAVGPDVTRFTLGVGDCVLLLSDGVADEQSEDGLRAALHSYKPNTHPKDFAAALLDGIAASDDQTALLVYIDERA